MTFFLADDTTFYNAAHLNHLIHEDLDHLLQWSNKFLCYLTPVVTDLGITFQDKLTFDEHISKITSTENRVL